MNKNISSLITILFVVLAISIPTSFNLFKTFSPDVTVSLNDLVNDFDNESDDGEEASNQFAEIEEIESEVLLIAPSMLLIHFSSNAIIHNSVSFISSYIFSIFIPPSR